MIRRLAPPFRSRRRVAPRGRRRRRGDLERLYGHRSRQDLHPLRRRAGRRGRLANFACAGFKGYPVVIYTGDLRESVVYGFPQSGAEPPVWESFSGFNSTRAKGRVAAEQVGSGRGALRHDPPLVGQRPDDAEEKIEVLVVEKVAQPGTSDGCASGMSWPREAPMPTRRPDHRRPERARLRVRRRPADPHPGSGRRAGIRPGAPLTCPQRWRKRRSGAEAGSGGLSFPPFNARCM